MNSLIEKKMYL